MIDEREWEWEMNASTCAVSIEKDEMTITSCFWHCINGVSIEVWHHSTSHYLSCGADPTCIFLDISWWAFFLISGIPLHLNC